MYEAFQRFCALAAILLAFGSCSHTDIVDDGRTVTEDTTCWGDNAPACQAEKNRNKEAMLVENHIHDEIDRDQDLERLAFVASTKNCRDFFAATKCMPRACFPQTMWSWDSGEALCGAAVARAYESAASPQQPYGRRGGGKKGAKRAPSNMDLLTMLNGQAYQIKTLREATVANANAVEHMMTHGR